MAHRSTRTITAIALAATLASCGGAAVPSTPLDAAAESVPTVPASPAVSPVAASPSVADVESPGPSGATTTVRPRPSFDATELEGFLTASLTLFDVSDADVAVSITYADPENGEFELGTYALGPSDHLAHAVPPGTYRVGFRVPTTDRAGTTCVIEISDGAPVTFFIASSDAIAVTRPDFKPSTAADLFVSTSPLCNA